MQPFSIAPPAARKLTAEFLNGFATRGGRSAMTRGRAQLAALRRALFAPERWVLLSGCDWHADAAGFPTDHARMLIADDADAR